MASLFIDANIFLCALGAEAPQREPCRELLAAVGEKRLDAVTNTEVLQELLYVRSRRLGVKDAFVAVRAAAQIVREVLPVTVEDVLLACRILERHPALSARDALHAAVMRNGSIHMMASMDAAFDEVTEVNRLDPQTALELAQG